MRDLNVGCRDGTFATPTDLAVRPLHALRRCCLHAVAHALNRAPLVLFTFNRRDLGGLRNRYWGSDREAGRTPARSPLSDRNGVAFRISAFGEKPAEAARQVSG